MNKKIVVKTLISASLGKVWDAWTKPEHIVRWNFASDDWQCPEASNDLKVGGKYSARMEAKDGSFGFNFVATYTEIDIKKKLVYIMEDGRVSTTDFIQREGMTEVITTFDSEDENTEEMQKNGWQSILNNFKKYIEVS